MTFSIDTVSRNDEILVVFREKGMMFFFFFCSYLSSPLFYDPGSPLRLPRPRYTTTFRRREAVDARSSDVMPTFARGLGLSGGPRSYIP